MDNKEKLKYEILKVFYDNIPHNKHFCLKFILSWIVCFSMIGIFLKTFLFILHPIIFVLTFVIFGLSALLSIVLYPNIKDIFLNKALDDDYLNKVMDKIRHEFLSNNNIYLEPTSNYPKEIQYFINDIMKKLTSGKNLATYFDIINLYKKIKSEIDKDYQTEIMKKYIV